MTEPIAPAAQPPIQPSIAGLSHPALRWVRETRADLDADDYSRMTLPERFALWAAARALAQSARQSQADRSPA